MPGLNPALGRALEDLTLVTAGQAGTCTSDQVRAAGLTADAVYRLVRSGQWVRLHRGVYRTAPGPVPLPSRMWAAHLALGPKSVLGHITAAHYCGLLYEPHIGPVTILVPEACTRVAQGVRTRRVLDPLGRAHPARTPPVTTVEETVCDVVAATPSNAAAAELVLRACRLRLTSPTRILTVADGRARQGRRWLLRSMCSEIAEGVTSLLESEYRRTVARAHGLPTGHRQASGRSIAGRRTYRDVAYRAFGVVVELDGRLGHEHESQILRDQLRDNASTLAGAATLRFGWLAVAGQSCAVAAQVGELLRLRGWPGHPRSCGRTRGLAAAQRRLCALDMAALGTPA